VRDGAISLFDQRKVLEEIYPIKVDTFERAIILFTLLLCFMIIFYLTHPCRALNLS
jgi:hypothetical protein